MYVICQTTIRDHTEIHQQQQQLQKGRKQNEEKEEKPKMMRKAPLVSVKIQYRTIMNVVV